MCSGWSFSVYTRGLDVSHGVKNNRVEVEGVGMSEVTRVWTLEEEDVTFGLRAKTDGN